MLASRVGDGGGTPLDVAIEDSLLRLSPGDKIHLRWWGVGSADMILAVNPEWIVVIPDLGSVSVRGKSFKAVRDSIQAMVSVGRRIKLFDLQVYSLSPVRVGVSGVVPRPGVLTVSVGARLSDMLRLAGWDIEKLMKHVLEDSPDQLREWRTPSLRQVRVIRAGSADTSFYDLSQAMRSGMVDQDPYVFSGDQVHFRSPERFLAVGGGVSGGFCEFLENEKVSTLLAACGRGPEGQMTLGRENGSFEAVDLDSPVPGDAVSLRIQKSSDKVAQDAVVWVRGMVATPGPYPVPTSGMDAKSILDGMGGASVPEDSIRLVAWHKDWPRMLRLNLRERTKSEVNVEAEAIRYAELRAVLVQQRSTSTGIYSSTTPILYPGDTLEIRPQERVVWVGGQVKRPGFVPWREGASVSDYVESAGGWGMRPWTSRTRIEDMLTGQVLSKSEIRPGSAILIPERKYLYFDQWITLAATTMTLLVSSYTLYIQATAD